MPPSIPTDIPTEAAINAIIHSREQIVHASAVADENTQKANQERSIKREIKEPAVKQRSVHGDLKVIHSMH